jgi:hypothetical protein
LAMTLNLSALASDASSAAEAPKISKPVPVPPSEIGAASRGDRR